MFNPKIINERKGFQEKIVCEKFAVPSVTRNIFSDFMHPTSEKLRRHIGSGLTIRCPSTTLIGSLETQESLLLGY